MFGPLARCYEGIAVHGDPMLGDVQFVFHTYHGFLAFFVQTEHRVSAALRMRLSSSGAFINSTLFGARSPQERYLFQYYPASTMSLQSGRS